MITLQLTVNSSGLTKEIIVTPPSGVKHLMKHDFSAYDNSPYIRVESPCVIVVCALGYTT